MLSKAIPLALHMQREDFERLATDSPIAAAVTAMMLWRGDDSSMTDTREFIVQFRGMPSYDDAIALFDDYDRRIAKPWSIPMTGGDFLHVEVTGDQTSDDHVQLTIRALEISGASRKPVVEPTMLEVSIGSAELPTSFAGQMIVARDALATYIR